MSLSTDAAAPLSKREKLIGICLLVFYLAMIAITIATLPYLRTEAPQDISERTHDAF